MREEDSRGEQPSAEDSGVMLEEATVARRKLKATDFRITQGMMRKSGRTQGCIGCEREQLKERMQNTVKCAEQDSRKSWNRTKS